jgi:N-terminal acetyltransferase B complex non-catalytic subunit
LKALALVRSGKEEEASELCSQVKDAQPTDEPTLQAATMAYKEVGQRRYRLPTLSVPSLHFTNF